MNPQLPNRYTLVSGMGEASNSLNAFDRALLFAGSGNYNLVKVSSILPPSALPGNIQAIPAGSLVYAAYGCLISDVRDELISAAVAVAVPQDPELSGMLMEGSFRLPKSEAEEKVRNMAQTAMDDRRYDVKEIISVSIEHTVRKIGAVYAAVLLWNSAIEKSQA